MIQDFTNGGLLDLLAQNNRVVCFDRPGFGHSQRPRFRIWTAAAQAALFVKAFNQIAIRDPVVLGHSLGALGSLVIEAQRPALPQADLRAGLKIRTASIPRCRGSWTRFLDHF
jgi:pimeloyl-ACP methyl ester carboxylesterase